MTKFGPVVFCKPDGSAFGDDDWDPGIWSGVHPPGVWILAMIYMYRGEREFGLALARRVTEEIIKRGWCWDQPNTITIDGSDGPRIGCDYHQNMILWSLPAALQSRDLTGPCKSGGLVDRVIQAGKPRE